MASVLGILHIQIQLVQGHRPQQRRYPQNLHEIIRTGRAVSQHHQLQGRSETHDQSVRGRGLLHQGEHDEDLWQFCQQERGTYCHLPAPQVTESQPGGVYREDPENYIQLQQSARGEKVRNPT